MKLWDSTIQRDVLIAERERRDKPNTGMNGEAFTEKHISMIKIRTGEG
jgi:hypothetical protein